jgi:hypothetical protein
LYQIQKDRVKNSCVPVVTLEDSLTTGYLLSGPAAPSSGELFFITFRKVMFAKCATLPVGQFMQCLGFDRLPVYIRCKKIALKICKRLFVFRREIMAGIVIPGGSFAR